MGLPSCRQLRPGDLMAWVILLTDCCISGQPHQAGPDPIQVTGPDAKLLISQQLAIPAAAPVPAAPAVCKPRTTKPPTDK